MGADDWRVVSYRLLLTAMARVGSAATQYSNGAPGLGSDSQRTDATLILHR